jgi:FAD/FMN-containing dehydrogenase
MPTFRNWSGSVAAEPEAILAPEDEAALVALVRRAGEESRGLRLCGSGHSQSPLVATDGWVVGLDALQGLVRVDAARRQATLRAGTKLHAAGALLHAHGLAMQNLGDVDVQALAGAVATGTHGTGPELGNVSSRVAGARLVLASGDVETWDEEDDAERLRAARVSVGLLGVMTELRLRCVPAFRLHERVVRMPVEECLAGLPERIAATRHFEFFWYPGRDFAEVKTLHPTERTALDPPAKYERIGWSHEILPSVRELRFFEMEYALPAEAGEACFRALRERVRARHPDLEWPVEYRTVAADDAWLSPAHGRATVTLSVHQDGRLPFRELFADLEPILREHGGRPHWGKWHTMKGADLRPLYPRFDDFAALRREVDPHGRFLNDHLRAIFE